MRSSPVKILANKSNVLPQDNGALKWNEFGQPSNKTPLKIKRNEQRLRENEFCLTWMDAAGYGLDGSILRDMICAAADEHIKVGRRLRVIHDDLGYIYIEE